MGVGLEPLGESRRCNTTFGINAVAFTALVEPGLQRIPAQAIVFLPTLLLNYLRHRYRSFRRSATLIPTTAWRRRRLLRTGSRGRRIGHLAMRFAQYRCVVRSDTASLSTGAWGEHRFSVRAHATRQE